MLEFQIKTNEVAAFGFVSPSKLLLLVAKGIARIDEQCIVFPHFVRHLAVHSEFRIGLKRSVRSLKGLFRIEVAAGVDAQFLDRL